MHVVVFQGVEELRVEVFEVGALHEQSALLREQHVPSALDVVRFCGVLFLEAVQEGEEARPGALAVRVEDATWPVHFGDEGRRGVQDRLALILSSARLFNSN